MKIYKLRFSNPGFILTRTIPIWQNRCHEFGYLSDCRLQVVDRLEDDPRAFGCPNQVRYQWKGTPKVGESLVFTQVYYPHAPYRSMPTSNNPNPNSKAAYANELQATAHASGVRVVQDTPEATILRLELETDQIEWVAFNPMEKPLRIGTEKLSSPLAYVE